MNDNERVRNILDGDSNQFSFIMEKYHNEFYSYIYKITLNYETTEDLLQEFFMLSYGKLQKYNESLSSLRTWMYKVLSNFMISYLRKKKLDYYNVESESDFDYLTEGIDDIEEQVIKEDQMKQIVSTMKQTLNKKQLQIMTLHYFSGLTPKEISETTEIPLKTIYKSIHSSIEKIRKVAK